MVGGTASHGQPQVTQEGNVGRAGERGKTWAGEEGKDQPGEVTNLARGQLNREK